MTSGIFEKKTFLPRLEVNEVLSRDLLSKNGQLVLPKGTVVTPSKIVRMRQFGVSELWVEVQQQDRPPIDQVQTKTAHTYQNSVTDMKNMFFSAKQHQIVNVENYQQTLEALATAAKEESNFLKLVMNLRTVDEYTFQHSVGVGLLCHRIGEWMGLSWQQCHELQLAATLHDIGKSLIDERILNKPGRLTAEEYEHVKQHAQFGYDILRRSGLDERLAAPARNHHERMDGSGYPRKLSRTQIDLYSRIVAVADVFNAMTSRRVYHDPVSYYKVLDELQQDSFGAMDPVLVSLFVKKMTVYLVGNQVILNDGTQGTVVHVPSDRPTRPLIQTNSGFVDLLQLPNRFIESVQSV